MRIKFPIATNDQRKYLSGLSAVACVAWSTPIYNFLVSYLSHETTFSVENLVFLTYCSMFSLTTLFFEYNVLGEKRWQI